MAAYILDAAGFVTSVFDGIGAPPNSTNKAPPANARHPLQFVNDAWLVDLPSVTWGEAPAEYWWIDIGPFFDRFGSKALGVTSSTDPQVQGLVTLLLPRQYVDLKRPDLPQMLGILQGKGLITGGEKDAVLSTPTTEYERHVKGLPQPSA